MLWEGFPPEFASWEPESEIHDDFIEEYEASMEAEAELVADEAAQDAEDAVVECFRKSPTKGYGVPGVEAH